MPKLKVDSLYEPIEVEIEGQTFQVKPITRDLLEKIDALDKDANSGLISAAYERLILLIDGGREQINRLDLRDLSKITEFIVTNGFRISRAEKNGSKPGDEKSPS